MSLPVQGWQDTKEDEDEWSGEHNGMGGFSSFECKLRCAGERYGKSQMILTWCCLDVKRRWLTGGSCTCSPNGIGGLLPRKIDAICAVAIRRRLILLLRDVVAKQFDAAISPGNNDQQRRQQGQPSTPLAASSHHSRQRSGLFIVSSSDAR